MISAADLTPLWEIARGDAKYDTSSHTSLCVVPGNPGKGQAAIHLYPGSDAFAEPAWPLDASQLAALNSEELRDGHRVLVRDLATPRIALGRLRHELEHARQCDKSRSTYEFMGVAQDVLRHALEQKGTDNWCGSSTLYNALPHEVDANRASAILTHAHFGPPNESDLTSRGAELFRDNSPVEASTLPRRLLALTALFPRSLDGVAELRGTTRSELVESLGPDAQFAWVKLSSDSTVSNFGAEMLSACPSTATIDAAQSPSTTWIPAREFLLAASSMHF